MAMTQTPPALRKRFGRNLRNARLNLGMTQLDLSNSVGVWLQTIQRWESGHSYPTPRRLQVVSAAVGVPIQELREGRSDGDDASED